ncbi:hypothetical protein M3Y94_00846500 [Aphelenchoides besseyi]|nr:hypothetical protein M3Y94_00846500 [Aphelenchoides besseyi]
MATFPVAFGVVDANDTEQLYHDVDSFRTDFKDDYNLFTGYQVFSILALVLGAIFALFTLTFAWKLVADVYLKCQQTVDLCKNKLDVCNQILMERAFSDELINRIPNFDSVRNKSEIESRLQSLYPKSRF